VHPARVPHRPRTRSLAAIGAVALLAAAFLGACASSDPKAARHAPATALPSSTSTPTGSTNAATTTTTTPSSPTTAPPSAVPGVTTLTEHDNGTTIALHLGDRLRVVLASTYWTFQPSSDPTVLHPDGQPVITPQTSGCVTGQGCGTVTADLTASSTGTTVVTATRTTCGEALACTPANGHYQVTITVTE
jgi:hypothetical protein